MAKVYKSKKSYLKTQTSKRLLSFIEKGTKHPNYKTSMQILKERMQKSEQLAKETNKKLIKKYGYASKIEEVPKRFTKKYLISKFQQTLDINKELIKEFCQNEKAVNIIMFGERNKDGKITHKGYIAEKYQDALQELISDGYTNEEAIAELERQGYTKENLRDIAEEIVRLNRFGYRYTDADEIFHAGLEGRAFVNQDYTKAIRYKDTSEFR